MTAADEARPQLWVLAGANGSGKTTYYKTYLQPRHVTWINADDIAARRWPNDPEGHAYEASRLAADMRTAALSRGQSFATETVFSHPSKLELLYEAKARDYQVTLIYIHLTSAALNMARVEQRRRSGGHAVPPDKIEQRRARLPALIAHAINVCDRVEVLDNSSATEPFREVFRRDGGALTLFMDPLPQWAQTLLHRQESAVEEDPMEQDFLSHDALHDDGLDSDSSASTRPGDGPVSGFRQRRT